MITPERVTELASKIVPEITALRQQIHSRPELAGEEVETAALIRSELQFTEIELLPPFLATDVVGLLQGSDSGVNVTLRADMDALPLTELNDLSYKSGKSGIMHACGHDGHTAVLLGVAKVLHELRSEFNGSVRFVFQPGEEVAALGRELVAAGALKDPEPAAVFALHGNSDYPVGSICSRPGSMMAACGFFKITIFGKGGHGSRPDLTVDPILTGCRVIEAFQSIVSRNIPPLKPAVVSVCRFTGGTNGNVIPAQVEIEGTTRFLEDVVGTAIRSRLEEILAGICSAMGATYTLDYSVPYLYCENTPACVDLCKDVTAEYLGPDHWLEMPLPQMGGEDFCYYIRDYPGALCGLGMGPDSAPLHNPKFNFNDEAVKNGIIFMTGIALETLKADGI